MVGDEMTLSEFADTENVRVDPVKDKVPFYGIKLSEKSRAINMYVKKKH